MMYSPELIQPFRDEVTQLGVKELLTAQDVDDAVRNTKGIALIFVNSVCGCAAGAARPAIALALKHSAKPDALFTVFAGQDRDATERARSYFTGQPPSSPCFALMRDGKLMAMIHRHQIEGRMPHEVAQMLTTLFDMYTSAPAK